MSMSMSMLMNINMDRFKEPEPEKYVTCAWCGGEVYKGEKLYAWDGSAPEICEECFMSAVGDLGAEVLARDMGLLVEAV